MGAAASIPDELTQEEAIKLAGDKWDEKLLTLWPEGAEKITKDQLVTLIKDVPIFAKRSVDEAGNVRFARAPRRSARRVGGREGAADSLSGAAAARENRPRDPLSLVLSLAPALAHPARATRAARRARRNARCRPRRPSASRRWARP